MNKADRQRNLAFGRFAEDRAVDFFITNGYAIRERNWRLNKLEIDLIVQTGNTIVFVEVKARSGRDMTPLEAVTTEKMRFMSKAADHYLRHLQGEYEYRYDIFTLQGDFDNYTVEHYPDAFLSPL